MRSVEKSITDTLTPFFSWCMRQLFWATTGCKLTVIFCHPAEAYCESVLNSWQNQFSIKELLSLQSASGRRRCRKKLKKIMHSFFRKMRRSPECSYVRHRFREMLGVIPLKGTMVYDIAEIDKKIDEQLTAYNREDVLETFPLYKIDYRVISALKSQVSREDYPETVLDLLLEASHNWDSIRQTEPNSKLLGINRHEEPDIEAIIDESLEFAQGKMDGDKLLSLARWLMGKMLVSQFHLYPYTNKRFLSPETPIGDDLTLGDMLSDDRAQQQFGAIEDRAVLENSLELLSASEREASELFLQASPQQIRRELGEKKYQATQRNFERALERLTELRKSGKLPT